MSIKSVLTGFLTANAGIVAVASDRVYPVALPMAAVRPALTYRRLPKSPHDQTITKASGTSLANFEIRAWGDTYEDADVLAEAVRVAMLSNAGRPSTIVAVVLVDDYDDYAQPQDGSERGIFSIPLIFHIRYSESVPTFS